MTWIKSGRATAIGSVPYSCAEAALTVIAASLPAWPHWPQLPGSSSEEGFVLQYIQPLVRLGLVAKRGQDLYFTRGEVGWDEKVVCFYEQYLAFQNGDAKAEQFFALQGRAFQGLAYFCEHFARYFPDAEGVKGQISGPLTVGLEIQDEKGKACFYDDQLLDMLLKCLETQGIMQIRKLQELGLPVLLFIDDPAIFLLGTAGYITLTDQEIQAALAQLIQPLHTLGAYVGVHVCAQIQWEILFDLPLDVISFDAYHYFLSMSLSKEKMIAYLERGGKIAWGLIPTEEQVQAMTYRDLEDIFAEQCATLDQVGVDTALLRQHLIWTPSCGTGTLSVQTTEHIYRLLREVSRCRK